MSRLRGADRQKDPVRDAPSERLAALPILLL
jgi:hypothetical protein